MAWYFFERWPQKLEIYTNPIFHFEPWSYGRKGWPTFQIQLTSFFHTPKKMSCCHFCWHPFLLGRRFFPERRFVAGFFRRLLAYLTPHISHTYLTPHISHTYPSHHTYPTHIHSKRIPPIRIPPIRIRSTRIPPVRIHAMRIHSKRLHQQVLQYVSHQYVSHQYKSVQHVSHQYVSMLCVSIQKVCISRNRKRIPPIHIPPIRIFNTYPTSTDPFNAYPFKKFASAGMAMSMSIIAYHFIPLLLGGNGNEYRNLAFPSISLQNYELNIIVSRAYEHEIHC